jgi:hypothetical protein
MMGGAAYSEGQDDLGGMQLFPIFAVVNPPSSVSCDHNPVQGDLIDARDG